MPPLVRALAGGIFDRLHIHVVLDSLKILKISLIFSAFELRGPGSVDLWTTHRRTGLRQRASEASARLTPHAARACSYACA
ncbi:hypothetical protein CaCOL14_010729 [Colletotrichum acutatum]